MLLKCCYGRARVSTLDSIERLYLFVVKVLLKFSLA